MVAQTKRLVALLTFFSLLLCATYLLATYRLPISNRTFSGGWQAPSLPEMTAVQSATAETDLNGLLKANKAEALSRLFASDTAARKDVVVIMGNEAGDTDSMASAILLAHLLSHPANTGGRTIRDSLKLPEDTLFTPLMQFPRKDLRLRGENEMLLHLLDVDPSSLLFLDDLPQDRSRLLAGGDHVKLALTDHPSLSKTWEPYDEFSKRVVAVIDHHADDGSHKNAPLRVLMGPGAGQVGSAVSVVVDLFSDKGKELKLSTKLADLALAAVLIDTDDLRPMPRGKATEVDLTAGRLLAVQSSLIRPESRTSFLDTAVRFGGDTAASAAKADSSFFAKSHTSLGFSDGLLPSSLASADASEGVLARTALSTYWAVLSAVKLDVARLSSADLLHRDYKETTFDESQFRSGFSSVPVGLSEWIRKKDLSPAGGAGAGGKGEDERWQKYWSTIDEFMREKRLQWAVVGTSFRDDGEEMDESNDSSTERDGKHRRELLLACRGAPASALFKTVLSTLESDAYAQGLSSPDSSSQQLFLESPWKGRRLASTGKRERVAGLDEQGRWPQGDMQVAVYIQRNARASRKVYLPAVMHAIRAAAASVPK